MSGPYEVKTSFHRLMRMVPGALYEPVGLDRVGHIILMGHSGGATLMTAYQAIAENGPQVFQGPEKILPYPDDDKLPPADGLMLLDANWGNAAMQLFSLDPAVVSEDDGMHLDPEYNLFEEKNGFHKDGSTVSDEFIKKFQRKQGQRNNEILCFAQERWEKVLRGEGHYSDDEPLVIPGANQVFFNNKLYAQDIRLMSHTRQPRELIHADGSSTVEIVHSLRGPENPESMTHNMMDGARVMTVYNYLTSLAEKFGLDENDVLCVGVGEAKGGGAGGPGGGPAGGPPGDPPGAMGGFSGTSMFELDRETGAVTIDSAPDWYTEDYCGSVMNDSFSAVVGSLIPALYEKDGTPGLQVIWSGTTDDILNGNWDVFVPHNR